MFWLGSESRSLSLVFTAFALIDQCFSMSFSVCGVLAHTWLATTQEDALLFQNSLPSQEMNLDLGGDSLFHLIP